jgi:hypothetical protein
MWFFRIVGVNGGVIAQFLVSLKTSEKARHCRALWLLAVPPFYLAQKSNGGFTPYF